MEKHRTKAQSFVRKRVLTFARVIAHQIQIINKSLSVSISNFIKRLDIEYEDCTKQAYSKARQNIKPSAYIEINNAIINRYYADDLLKKHKGYLLLASDGTKLQLPNEEKIIKKYGVQIDGTEKPMAMALSSVLYDVLNGMVIHSIIGGVNKNERTFVQIHVRYLKKMLERNGKKAILILDRGYPSLYLLYYLEECGIKYLIRSPKNFIQEIEEFAQKEEKDITVKIDVGINSRKYDRRLQKISKGKELKVRMVKPKLPNGADEYLLTNLEREEFEMQELYELYGQRWKIETYYNFQKNYLEIENFSAQTVNGIKQDYYSKIVASNLRTLIINDVQTEIDEESKDKNLQHKYKVNGAVALGIVKEELVSMVLGNGTISESYAVLREKIKRRQNAVKKCRNCPRNKKKSKRKYKRFYSKVT